MATNQQIYEIVLKNSQAIQALSQLQTKVSQTSDAFGKLKNAFAGLVAANVVKSAFEAANAMSDLSNASNIAIESILGFKKAIREAGGDTADVEQGIGRFAQAIDAASSGSKEAQDRFLKLGISLQDLRTLSEGELLNKTIKALGEGTGGAESMADGMAIFGKSYRSVGWNEVAGSIDKTTEAAKKSAESYKQAGEAFQKFQSSLAIINGEIIKALAPIADGVAKILAFSDAIGYFIKIAIQIGLVIASFTLLGKIISWGSALMVGLGEGAAFVGTAFSTVTNLFRNFGGVMKNLEQLGGPLTGTLKVMRGYFGDLGAWAIKSIPGIGALIGVLAVLGGALWDGVKALGSFLGINTNNKDATDKAAEAAKNQANAVRDVTDAYKSQREAIDKISKAFEDQNKKTRNQLDFETSLIGKSKEYADAEKAKNEIYVRAQDEIEKLIEQRKNLTKEEQKAGLGNNIDKEIEQIKKARDADMARAATASKNNNATLNFDELRKYSDQLAIDRAKELQTIKDNIAKSTMSELEKRLYDIQAQARANGMAKIAQEEQRLGRKLSEEERQAYLAKALEGLQELMDAEEQSYKNSRKAAVGWKQAFNDYAENASNAAENSKRIFQTMAQSMEDTLMKFFTTGKLGWKDFANTVLQELLRIEVRKMIAGVGSMSGGIMGGIGSLLGFASGGIIPTNGPVLVGERGPEILSGVGGRTVTPNSQLGTNTFVTYNINAVDSLSFKQMIARDPSFIHAVASQGAKTIPGRA